MRRWFRSWMLLRDEICQPHIRNLSFGAKAIHIDLLGRHLVVDMDAGADAQLGSNGAELRALGFGWPRKRF